MSDIIERLRADPIRNFDEAILEIERLRAIEADMRCPQCDKLRLELGAARAEITRLENVRDILRQRLDVDRLGYC
jgi:hypothetical protein